MRLIPEKRFFFFCSFYFDEATKFVRVLPGLLHKTDPTEEQTTCITIFYNYLHSDNAVEQFKQSQQSEHRHHVRRYEFSFSISYICRTRANHFEFPYSIVLRTYDFFTSNSARWLNCKMYFFFLQY